MSFRVDTAVLVLAAGPGTRMRSDTPKVLHTVAGRTFARRTAVWKPGSEPEYFR